MAWFCFVFIKTAQIIQLNKYKMCTEMSGTTHMDTPAQFLYNMPHAHFQKAFVRKNEETEQ